MLCEVQWCKILERWKFIDIWQQKCWKTKRIRSFSLV